MCRGVAGRVFNFLSIKSLQLFYLLRVFNFLSIPISLQKRHLQIHADHANIVTKFQTLPSFFLYYLFVNRMEQSEKFMYTELRINSVFLG